MCSKKGDNCDNDCYLNGASLSDTGAPAGQTYTYIVQASPVTKTKTITYADACPNPNTSCKPFNINYSNKLLCGLNDGTSSLSNSLMSTSLTSASPS